MYPTDVMYYNREIGMRELCTISVIFCTSKTVLKNKGYYLKKNLYVIGLKRENIITLKFQRNSQTILKEER